MERAKRCKWLIALSLLLSGPAAMAAWSDVNMRQGATEISHQVYQLHMTILGVCTVIGILVFGTMIVSMLLHRKSLGAKAASFHENTRIEIVWTVIPVLILLSLAIPSTATLRAMYDSGDPDVDIAIRGFQWKWQYTYLNDDPTREVQFMSSLRTPRDEIHNLANKSENYLLDVDNPLVLPAGKRVRFLITSNDVIHSWFMPDFAIKKDAIPGFVHEAWTVVDKPGIYRGQCAELCGKDHGFMPIVVRVVEEDEYEKWLSDKQEEARVAFETVGKVWTMDELMAKGEEVYSRNCITCHQANGEGLPPAFPALKGSAIATGPIQGHADIVLHGKAGTAMQAFSAQLNAAELAAVITWERNSWGNDTGDMIQPSEINDMLTGGQ